MRYMEQPEWEVGIAAIKRRDQSGDSRSLSPHAGMISLSLASWLRREKARGVDTYLQGGQGNLSGSISKKGVFLRLASAEKSSRLSAAQFFSTLITSSPFISVSAKATHHPRALGVHMVSW
ncbi:MAG: hypothetical protein ACLRL4_09260 [Bifidobacterium bifidum]